MDVPIYAHGMPLSFQRGWVASAWPPHPSSQRPGLRGPPSRQSSLTRVCTAVIFNTRFIRGQFIVCVQPSLVACRHWGPYSAPGWVALLAGFLHP